MCHRAHSVHVARHSDGTAPIGGALGGLGGSGGSGGIQKCASPWMVLTESRVPNLDLDRVTPRVEDAQQVCDALHTIRSSLLLTCLESNPT